MASKRASPSAPASPKRLGNIPVIGPLTSNRESVQDRQHPKRTRKKTRCLHSGF